MLDLVRNIIAFTGTFLIISCVSIFVLKYITYLFTNNYNHQQTSLITVIIGVTIALLLIPFYYFPC